jgi:hypothetical protein
MRKAYFIWLLLLLATIISCKRNELKGLNGSYNKNKCDYEQATVHWDKPETYGPITLFTKSYDASSRLQSIYCQFRNVATGIQYSFNLTVSYQPGKMIFTRDNGDTTAVLNFGANGRLISASTAYPFYPDWGGTRNYNFIYNGNMLTEMQITGSKYSGEPGHLIPYIQLAYDNGNKNISRLTFYGISRDTYKSWIDYHYDYSRKARAQVYPDDMLGDYDMFYFFLKYLNVIPVLQPENILSSSLSGSDNPHDYPGSYERQYSNHQFDAERRLVSYTQQSVVNNRLKGIENWTIDWKCFK